MPDLTTELNRIIGIIEGQASAGKVLTVDGSKNVSGINISGVNVIDAENVKLEELVSDPTTPGSGYQVLYIKSSGLFLRKSSGEIITIFNSPNPVILPDDDTTEIIVGDKTIDENIIIEFTAIRSGLGKNVGRIDVINKSTSVIVNWTFSAGDEVGIDFSGHLSGNNIVLDCIVDDSSVNDVTFKYDIFTRKI